MAALHEAPNEHINDSFDTTVQYRRHRNLWVDSNGDPQRRSTAESMGAIQAHG